MVHIAILFCIGVFFSATPTNAETITQKRAEATNLGLYGGQPEDIAIDANSNAVYVANFAPSGIFSSADKGETWNGLPVKSNYGTGKAVEIDQDTGDVYALIGDSIIKSTDHGSSWTEVSKDHGLALGQVMVFAHDRLIVASNTGGVYISSDGGDTFSSATIDAAGSITWLAAATTEEVYYAVVQINNSSEKLYKSTNGGQSWTDMDIHDHGMVEGGRLYEVGVDPLDADHIVVISVVPNNDPYQTTDGGATWTAITDGDESINGGYVTFDSTGRMYIGSSYSDNPTAETPTWNQINTTTPLSSIYADEGAVDPNDPDIVFMNSGMGVAKSTNRGVSWTDEYTGITSVKIFDIVQSGNKDVVWIGANGGLARSTNFTDDNPSWDYPILPAPGVSNIKAVWVDPNDSNIVIAGLSTFLKKSTDGGDTWDSSSAPAFSGQIQDIVQSPVAGEEDTLYAIHWNDSLAETDTGGVFMSTNAGDSWSDLDLPGDAPAVALAIGPDGKVYVGIGGDDEDTGVYVYDGSSWDHLTGNFSGEKTTSLLVDPENEQKIFLTAESDGSEGGLFVSTDSGATWTKTQDGLEQINNLDSLTIQTSTNPDTLYVAGQNGSTLNGVILKSSNGGKTWHTYYTGLKQENFYALLFDGLTAGNDRGIYEIKTNANLKLTTQKNDGKYVLRAQLKDASTNKKLKKRQITFYKKIKGGWKKIGKAKTNKKGIAQLERSLKKGKQIKAVWKPGEKDTEEYNRAQSNKKRLR